MDEVKQAIAQCAALQDKNPGFATWLDFSQVLTAFQSLEQTNRELARENALLRGLPTALTTGEEAAHV